MARRRKRSATPRSRGPILASSLAVTGLDAGYGAVRVLEDVSLSVEPGQTVVLLGTNGNGKSTLMKCVMGIVPPAAGSITAEIDGTKFDLIGRSTARAEIGHNLEMSYETVPVLRERRRQLSGSLSGGEQQMLALARALMSAPKILLIDEPSVGLAPVLVKRTIEKIKELKERYQLTVLMAEQNFNQAVRIADRGYVIVHGKIAFEGRSADELNNNELVRKFYLGL